MADMRWIDAILRVLQEADEPLHYTEIAQLIIDNRYRTSVGATPANTVDSLFSHDELRPLVRKVSPGFYEFAASEDQWIADATLTMISDSTGLPGTEESTDPDEEAGLIKAFGMFWLRQEIDWSTRNPKILGVQQPGGVAADFSAQEGVYLLYDGDRVVYVGSARGTRLGTRLWEHTRDRLTGRWNRFSWFGVRAVDGDGSLALIPQVNIQTDVLIATMEALLVEGLEPPQNRRQIEGFSALEFIQAPDREVG